ncbi:expressed unknown protein [Seminavis robusta]|uniref:J domain-containing protein n=1 Tax=Seminavis robusta TaxID=568900 RepID=A0A9N8DK33_9STRA|nr:expressed unknown protein [Seminavis robusta]|eukprot:Sro124_g059890.1 n/a (471) ;mRNA; r:53087-54499
MTVLTSSAAPVAARMASSTLGSSHKRSSLHSASSVERQLREKILYQIDKILLQSPPSRTSLYNLLLLCNPDLDASALDAPIAREKAFRAVKARLHPDKHALQEQPRVTLLFQNVQTFYVECCHAMAAQDAGSRYRKQTSMPSYQSTPQKTPLYTRRSTFSEGGSNSPKNTNNNSAFEFNCFAKWPFLKQIQRDTPFQAVSTSELHYHLAYACLNYRGAIVHGQTIDCTYQVPANFVETAASPTSIPAVWDAAGFPTDQHLRLTSVDELKKEIQQHGPVVSTSFGLDPNYYQSISRHAGNFSERHVGHCHPLLIVGWTMTSQGSVWLVQGLRGTTFPMGMGQFQIDAHAMAPPTCVLLQKSWQSPGPFWDVPDISLKCLAWKEHFDSTAPRATTVLSTLLEIVPLESSDIDALGDLWNVGLHAVISERRVFVLRDKNQMAQSRRVLLRDLARVTHKEKGKVWKVTVSVVRQ